MNCGTFLRYITILVLAASSIVAQSKATSPASERSPDKDRKLVATLIASAAGSREPVFIDREMLTDAEYEQIQLDREIRNLNLFLMNSGVGEARVLGRITAIECKDGVVKYEAHAARPLSGLTSPDFRSVKLSILQEGTLDRGIGCGADISQEPVVIGYRQAGRELRLLSIHFVPKHFRLMSEIEIANAPNLIIRGDKDFADTAANARLAATELAELEKKRSQIELQQAEQSLRDPREGEIRALGRIEGLECGLGQTTFVVRAGDRLLRLTAASMETLVLANFAPRAAQPSISCLFEPPKLSAVVTYVPRETQHGSNGSLVAIEFVPEGFEGLREN